MSYTSPKYALTAPDNETELRKLGTETKAMVQRIEAVLEAFDYDGADPNLVLARIVALESRPRTLGGRVLLTAPSGGGLAYVDITFPPGHFTSVPRIALTSHNQASINVVMNLSVAAASESGFRINMNRSNEVPTNIDWIAIAADEA